MNAIVAYGSGNFRWEKVNFPSARDKEVIIKILGTGICAGDRKIYEGQDVWWNQSFPYIPGHEFIGEIVEVGKKVANEYKLRKGTHVVAEIIIPCHKCYYCQRGWYHFCSNGKYYGHDVNGSWAEYMRLEKNSLIWKLPKLNPPWIGALIEPLSCAIHGIERADIGLDDTVVIAGMGSIGLLMLQVAKQSNPNFIIALDINKEALSLAKKNGADSIMNPNEEKVLENVNEITSALGCDVFIEASGSAAAVELGLKMLRKKGRMVIFGVYDKKMHINPTYISDIKELEIRGSHISPHTYPAAIRLLEKGLVDFNKVVTHVFPLARFSDGLAAIPRDEKPRAKVILIPSK